MKSMLRFPLNVMIANCDYLLENCKSIFDQHPMLQALFPHIQDVRNNLIWTAADTPNSEQMDQWQAEANQLDERHDDLNRAVYFVLGGMAEYTQDFGQKTALLNLRDLLFPMALRVNRLSWMAEAGEALRLAKQLENTDTQHALQRVSIEMDGVKSDLLAWTQEIVQVGQKLGEVARKLTHHKATSVQKPTTVLYASLREARQGFFQMIRALQESSQIALRNQPQQEAILWKALNNSLVSTAAKTSGGSNLSNPAASNPGSSQDTSNSAPSTQPPVATTIAVAPGVQPPTTSATSSATMSPAPTSAESPASTPTTPSVPTPATTPKKSR